MQKHFTFIGDLCKALAYVIGWMLICATIGYITIATLGFVGKVIVTIELLLISITLIAKSGERMIGKF